MLIIIIWLISDDNREVVLSAGGCQTLAEQIDKCSDTSSEEFSSDRYKCVACGCILNLAADNGEYMHGRVSYRRGLWCSPAKEYQFWESSLHALLICSPTLRAHSITYVVRISLPKWKVLHDICININIYGINNIPCMDWLVVRTLDLFLAPLKRWRLQDFMGEISERSITMISFNKAINSLWQCFNKKSKRTLIISSLFYAIGSATHEYFLFIQKNYLSLFFVKECLKRYAHYLEMQISQVTSSDMVWRHCVQLWKMVRRCSWQDSTTNSRSL